MSFTSDFDGIPPAGLLLTPTRFDAQFDTYARQLKRQPDAENFTVTLIARSPISPPARALVNNLGRFRFLPLKVGIVFAQIEPTDGLSLMVQSLLDTCLGRPADIIRWAENRALHDAHERLTLGTALCWTGDSMRRSEDSRSAIDRVEEGGAEVLAQANASFDALWRASRPLPRRIFGDPVPTRPFIDGERLGTSPVYASDDERIDDFLHFRRH